jgi:raffinose/stachyose/melibiose transport system permease protein
MRGRYTRRTLLRELGLIGVAAVFALPFYALIAIALDTTAQSYEKPFAFPSSPQWGNFSQAWQTSGQASLGHPFVHSLIITLSTVVLVIVVGSFCAYVIARRAGRLSNTLYVAFLIGIVLPLGLGVIPLFVAMRHLGLIGNYEGFILLNVGLHVPFAVFLYTGFIRALPRDYEEAARVDGAGTLRTYAQVVFPLLLPITATVAVLVGIGVWNEFFLALIFLAGTHIETLPVALSFLDQGEVARWNLIFAGICIVIAPVLAFFLVAQRHVVRSITPGVKG